MARNSAIAKRMEGPKSDSSASRSYSNYRKILFSPDDMASFENLLDQVEDADRPRYKPPVETPEEQPGAWCTKLNIAVLVVAIVTCVVSYDLTRTYIASHSGASVHVDRTLEQTPNVPSYVSRRAAGVAPSPERPPFPSLENPREEQNRWSATVNVDGGGRKAGARSPPPPAEDSPDEEEDEEDEEEEEEDEEEEEEKEKEDEEKEEEEHTTSKI